MSSPQEMHVNFRHLGTDYNINLVKGEKSDHSVEINGVTYAVLGDKEKLDTVCKILESVSLVSVSSAEDLKGRLSLLEDISFPQGQKIDSVFQKTLIIKSEEQITTPDRMIAAKEFLHALKKKDEFSGVILVHQGNSEPMIGKFQPTGLDQLDKNKFNENTPFNLASVGKWFTGVAILQLVDQNKVKLDDPVSKYLELDDYKLTGAHQEYRNALPQKNVAMLKLIHDIRDSGITIRELLTMTSGLKDGDSLAENPTVHSLDRSEDSREYGYSNYGYQLLARVVQNESGMSFSNYIKEQIFLKSGMPEEHADRAVSNNKPQNAPAAQFGNEIPAQLKKQSPSQFEDDKLQNGYFSLPERDIPSTDGNGCYWMSAHDLLTVSKSIIESEDILKNGIKKQMLEGELGLYNKSGQSKGFKSKFYGRPGQDIGMSAGLDIIEGKEGFTYSIILSNQGDGNKCRAALRNAMLEAED
jgi:CubicO group peptidase (beta-lactamase class C family)